MKILTLLIVGACAATVAGCTETGRRGYGPGYGYERRTVIVEDNRRDRREWERRQARQERRDDRREWRDDRRKDARDRRDDRRDRRDDWRDDRRY
ncbi:hypothetical protein ACFSCV_03385 [Methylopila henanensis]|uniref:Lipoprotein n=1 Tax=Methylopila henanensis TaxID=873516 RepID=A0ABW4K472_9HYPH